MFHRTGFSSVDDSTHFRPCASEYHLPCVRLGAPFYTRLKANGGLTMPPYENLQHFICEACTVRSQLQRELRWDGHDYSLLALERARIIDMAHHWSAGTYKRYQGHLRFIRKFEHLHGVTILEPPTITKPPTDASIPMMWCQESYALRPGGNRAAPGDPIAWTTVRGLRSAANQYYSWLYQFTHPSTAVLDEHHRVFRTNGQVPNASIGYSFLTKGMNERRGDDTKPSVALHYDHISWMEGYVDQLFLAAKTPQLRRLYARVGLTVVSAWLSWLRGGELFGMDWDGNDVIEPETGPSRGLPPGVGAVLWKLLAQTKSNRTSRADIAMAYTASSGLSIGKWLHRLRESMGLQEFPTTATPILCHEDGRRWTSQYFRSNFLIPMLDIMRRMGDPFLSKYDGSPGNSLSDNFYSLHTFRSGGRTHVSRKRPGCQRKARPEEVSDHGRWREKLSGMTMPRRYLQAPLLDRLALTLFCM
jgi:hypothetical protein